MAEARKDSMSRGLVILSRHSAHSSRHSLRLATEAFQD